MASAIRTLVGCNQPSWQLELQWHVSERKKDRTFRVSSEVKTTTQVACSVFSLKHKSPTTACFLLFSGHDTAKELENLLAGDSNPTTKLRLKLTSVPAIGQSVYPPI